MSSNNKIERKDDSSGCKSKRNNDNEDDGTLLAAQTLNNKKKKKEERLLEFKWSTYSDGEETHFSMFEDETVETSTNCLSNTRAVIENEAGENHEYRITICLVDNGKSDHRRVLAEIDVDYWKPSITLMHFNQKSQDLAHFCRSLWSAAPERKDNDYSDMAIEFGESRYSHLDIITLIGEVSGYEDWYDHVMYINSAKLSQGSTEIESRELLDRFFSSFHASVIAHKTDLEKLGLMQTDDADYEATIGFISIGEEWFVGGYSSD